MKCMAMCRETVDRPGDALGWQLLPVSGGSMWWFCPKCSELRSANPGASGPATKAIRTLLSASKGDEST
jgi:hypothetical protein